MNDFNQSGKPEDRERLAFLERVARYQDGTLTPAEVQQLAEMISQDPAQAKLFQRMQVRTAAIHDLLRMDAFGQTSSLLDHAQEDAVSPVKKSQPVAGKSGKRVLASRRRRFVIAGLTSLSLLLCLSYFVWNKPKPDSISLSNPSQSATEPSVLLVEENRAKFFGQQRPIAGEAIELLQDYMLQSGLVKLKFPSGATAILEAPAIFQITSMDRLVLSTGGCSVHAPDGAEGFEVITPLTKVVDRGTRFYVNVRENNETEIHVIEGAADLYSAQSEGRDAAIGIPPEVVQSHSDIDAVRLTDGEAIRMGGFVDTPGQRMKFQAESYRAQLPDRLVNYHASSTADGTANELLSLEVQRNGELISYSADELVPIEVTWFRADPKPDSNGYLCGLQSPPERPEELLEDRQLMTGLINFGGQPLPLTDHPVINSNPGAESAGTPGLGIRFRRPVVNHAGPDVVLFEVQTFTNPQNGDPLHVYPMPGRPGLKPLTVTKFDLTIDSPAARRVAPLWSHRYPHSIESLAELKENDAPLKVEVSQMYFFVIGVGIDLSDLGYAEGEEVEGLFFQNAADETGSKVDPVFIAGLPPLNSKK